MLIALIITRLKDLIASKDGNLAIVFCLVLVAMMMSAGAALDYSTAVTVRERLQGAIDSAVLAAASKSTTLDQAYAKNVFMGNTPDFTYNTDISAATNSWTNVDSLVFTVDASGNVVGTAHARMKTSLVAIAGVSVVNISVSAKAKATPDTKISSAVFKIKSAQGAYDKDIYFYTRDATGKILSNTLILQYDYTLSGGVGTKKFTPTTASSTTITVGSYASYGYEMIVYEDNSYTGKHINPVTHYSDDADASKWTKVAGACTDPSGSTNNWEDGGDSNYLDFVFTDTCTESSSGSKNVRLIE